MSPDSDGTAPLKGGAAKATFTPGPWEWFGNARNQEIYLATVHSGRRYVMGFQRWGMRGAQPMFQPAEHGLVAADKLVTFEVGDRDVRGVTEAKANDSVYRLDINGIDCADAHLIAAAPALYEALEWAVNHFEGRTRENAEQLSNCIDKCIDALALARGAKL